MIFKIVANQLEVTNQFINQSLQFYFFPIHFQSFVPLCCSSCSRRVKTNTLLPENISSFHTMTFSDILSKRGIRKKNRTCFFYHVKSVKKTLISAHPLECKPPFTSTRWPVSNKDGHYGNTLKTWRAEHESTSYLAESQKRGR